MGPDVNAMARWPEASSVRDSRIVMPPPTISNSGVAGSSQIPGQSATGCRTKVRRCSSMASRAVSKSAS